MNILDTYALVEISRGNSEYAKIMKYQFCIPETTFAEFYGIILRNHNRQTADYWFKKLKPFIKQASLNIFIQASIFKYKNNKERLSFFDCVGYCFALDNQGAFVTGDEAFKNKKHVMFVK